MSNCSIILLFLQIKKFRCREEEICPGSKSKSVEGLRLDLWSSRVFICCSPLRSQLPFCWRQSSLIGFALPNVHSVLGAIRHCLFYAEAAHNALNMDPLFLAHGLEYLHLQEVMVT